MFRGRKGSAAGTGDVMGSHVNRDGAAPDMAIYGGNAFGHSVSPTAHLLGKFVSMLYKFKNLFISVSPAYLAETPLRLEVRLFNSARERFKSAR